MRHNDLRCNKFLKIFYAFFSTGDCVDASFMLSCLNAASRSSAFDDQQFSTSTRSRKTSTSDVSVTIGANTKLTISPDFEPGGPVRRSGQLRRSRSGLPVLGTSVLQRTESPSKKLTQRNKISTVYLNSLIGMTSPSTRPSRSRITRSESVVTVTGVTQHQQRRVCECTERVTVNGQHHCFCDNSSSTTMSSMIGQFSNDFDRCLSTSSSRFQPTSIPEVNSPPETQPNSLIDI